MKQVTTVMGDSPVTMSSVELHKLTGKNHADVMRDIRKMLKQLGDEEGHSKFAGSYLSEQNKSLPCFNLPRREVDILLTGYSIPLRAKVIDRWRELESEVVKPVNLSDASALRGLLLGYTEQVLKLEHKITEDKPKVEYFDDVRDSTNTQTIGEFAKVLKFGEKKLFKWMRESEILMTDNKPYQKHLDAGHFRVLDKATTKADGKKITYTQTVLTGKGKQYIQKRLKKAGNPDLSE